MTGAYAPWQARPERRVADQGSGDGGGEQCRGGCGADGLSANVILLQAATPFLLPWRVCCCLLAIMGVCCLLAELAVLQGCKVIRVNTRIQAEPVDFACSQMERMDSALEAVKRSFSSVRTGRASPAMLDRVQVGPAPRILAYISRAVTKSLYMLCGRHHPEYIVRLSRYRSTFLDLHVLRSTPRIQPVLIMAS